MSAFMDSEFLLTTKAAQHLYHDCCERLPIVDYHCHLSPAEIADDKHFSDLTEVWLGGDHYKWRLMRACGEPETLITCSGDPYAKFLAFARTIERCPGNPVAHWAHLELRRYFACDLILNVKNAPEIWKICNARLQSLSAREMIRMSNVTALLTTDDPADSLAHHEKIAADHTFSTVVCPAWRPDRALSIEKNDFSDYIHSLGNPQSFSELCKLLNARMDYFAAHGCRASDHGLTAFPEACATERELDAIFERAMEKRKISEDEANKYRYSLMQFLARSYAKRGWAMEMHFGPMRNNHRAMFETLGPDTGFDAIAPKVDLSGLSPFLSGLASENLLPATILFSLSPNDSAFLNALAGCFQKEGARGWVQQGAAWWFNDTLTGMRRQMTAMADTFPVANFLGMVTDSRSFLSYARHEYFRRAMCGLFGEWADAGMIPDMDALGRAVQDISYFNARNLFFPEVTQ